MASISVREDGFLRRVAGGSGVGGVSGAGPNRKPTGGVAGKRLPVDEYIASLPAQAAIVGGKRTLETLTSLPPAQQPKGRGANGAGTGIGIGINNNNKIGISNAGGIGSGINALGSTGIGINKAAGGIGAGANTLGMAGIGINAAGAGVNKLGGASAGINKTAGGIGASAETLGMGAENTADEPVNTEDVDEADETGDAEDEEAADADAGAGSDKTGAELTSEEQSVVNELRNRDREVRAHEQAHISAGGAYIRGGASYQYRRGPDNKSYAVGGEVGIDTAPERDDPEATITKMQAVRAAATAPADPSAQDRAVAAAAARNENIARSDLAEEERNSGV